MEAFVKDTFAASSTTSMKASMEAFVEATSMKSFAKASVEASGILLPWKLPNLS